ncbi:hypothetical protein [Alteromonas oceanisediminis]|uniref:hypothetical protein n=1 Tax=Alteromonas oceanisediminis TaxID=2836180 RepID=UPI001BDA5A1D|nr:hypothetical protein [Alteromonas oceanisediminis]MBT0586331.1 hypothetical protein [Alteromonas oceanisediminis]
MSENSVNPPPNNHKNDAQIRKALQGDIAINAIDAFRRGNTLTRQSFGTFALAAAIIFTVVVVCLYLALSVLNVSLENYNSLDATPRAVIDIVLVLILSPLMAGMMMMGISKARGKHIEVSDLFQWISLTIILALGSLIASILVQVGLRLLVLPGLYLAIATTFTLPLIADKKMTALSAIMLSIRVVNKYLGQFVVFFLITFALFFIAILTLGIGLVWVIPLYFNAKGVLYEQLFGHGDLDVVSNSPEGSTFDA